MTLPLNQEVTLYPDSLLILGRSFLFMFPPGDKIPLFNIEESFRGLQPFHQSYHQPHHDFYIEHIHQVEDFLPTQLAYHIEHLHILEDCVHVKIR